MRTFFLEIWDGLFIALRAIGVNKMRSILTTLGIIIGIASVTAMATVINGIEGRFEQSMSQLGADVLYVEKWPWVSGPNFKWWEYINRAPVTADLAEAIQSRSSRSAAAAPVIETRSTVQYAGTTLSRISIEGSTSSFALVHTVDLTAGRFYNDFDHRSARHVAVIGATVAEKLFPNEQPLGKLIRVGGNRMEVIGVMKKEGAGIDADMSSDQRIRIPYGTFRKLFGDHRRSISVQVRVASMDDMEAARDELTGILRVARRLDAFDQNNFEINDQSELRKELAPIKGVIYGIGIFLTALALLVGGIGVMNIMFVSVKERTREIGLRKAVGARKRTILTQFLTEAVILCLIGGAIGVLLSALLAFLISQVFPASLPFSTVVLAFGICVLIGIGFGLAPAWTAAKQNPIESLRYE